MTLRGSLLVLAVAAAIAGIVLAVLRIAPGLPLAIGAGVFAILVAGESWRYRHRRPAADASGFQTTAERYRDPGTGEWMAVEYDPRSGARRYVKADGPPLEGS
ncbi:MAG TPA: hypothetical protein VFX38_07605 [Gammaproteobacteria bacterium]|nr:hypothetical protein [Gammaproteobacteria bacterium]